MKKIFVLAFVGLMTVMPLSAQYHRGGGYYGSRTGHFDRYGDHRHGGNVLGYVGFRVGGSFANVSSDNHYLDGSDMKSGLNIGAAFGLNLVKYSPFFFETGLYYTEKGGKGDNSFQYNLNYLEVPLVLKYIHFFDGGVSIQPFFGGYLSCGVGGKVKNFEDRVAYSSFGSSSDQFKRFDGGLRFGIGAAYQMVYADLTYDLGLADIGQDYFDETKTRALMLNVGVHF